MRVRKSVPEGYKTQKTNSGHPLALPSIQTTLSNVHLRTNTTTTDAYSVKPPRDPVPDVLQHQRELLPFCGLHKIGGFAEQPVTNVHLYGGGDEGGDRPVNLFPLPAEAFNQPFSSQSSSTESLPPNPMNVHKRSWQDEDHEKPLNLNSNFLFALPMKVAEDDVPVSPLSETPRQSINALPQAPLRPFAQPKTRRQPGRLLDGASLKESEIQMDVENVTHFEEEHILGGSGDFDEAPFLQPWVAGGSEVEMSGM
jgi:hypothetical protein